jgi:hypothetical protein
MNAKVKLGYIFLIVFSCHFVQAQSNKAGTLLWKISGPRLQQPSYIFGTFHLICQDDLVFPDTLKFIIHHSKQIYFEIKMDDPDLPKKMMQSIKMNNEHQLKEFLTANEYDSVSNIFQNKTQIPLQFVANYKPYLLTSLLYPSMLGCAPVAFEKEIQKYSDKDSLPVFGLESLEFQLSIFDSIPYKEQAKMLAKTVLQYNNSKKELASLVAMYKKRDVVGMQKAVDSDKDFGKYETILLKKRNENWIPVITKAITEHSTFIAVGAGHLSGPDGVLNLLKKQGFIVSPVYY